MTRLAPPLVALLALAISGCGKVQEKASEKMVEKAIESSMAKDGSTAKVDLSQGGMKMSTTDASGKTTQMEMGNAKISEADLGLPFYPGSKPTEGSSRTYSILTSVDPSAVVSFTRCASPPESVVAL